MLRHRTRSLTVPIGFALMALLALPMAVLGNTSGPIAQTGGMTATLPLLGSSLTVAVKLDVVGNVSQVDLDPIGTWSATKVGPHAVSFASADGTTQVKIRARGDKLSIKASAGSLAALVGPGSWSADVFGTGEKTTVAYTVGAAPDGSPTLVVNSVSAPAGITVDQGTPKTESDGDGSSAAVRIGFALNGFAKKLTIKVSVDSGDEHPASLKIELTGRDRQKLSGPLADLVGPHAWSGRLCDGTAVGIAYDVLPAGTVAFGSATGGTTTVKSNEHGFSVRFDGTKVRVKVRLVQVKDGTYALKVDGRTGRCGHTPAPLPTVNTPVAPGSDVGGSHDGSHDSWDGH